MFWIIQIVSYFKFGYSSKYFGLDYTDSVILGSYIKSKISNDVLESIIDVDYMEYITLNKNNVESQGRKRLDINNLINISNIITTKKKVTIEVYSSEMLMDIKNHIDKFKNKDNVFLVSQIVPGKKYNADDFVGLNNIDAFIL